MASASSSPVPVLEAYQIVRAQIAHEDNLVSQRLSWLIAAQSFLFTAYAISLNGPMQLRMQGPATLLTTLLPIVGFCSATLLWITILAGVGAMKRLRTDFERGYAAQLPDGVPPIQTRGATLVGGQIGPLVVPPLFIVVWLALLIRG